MSTVRRGNQRELAVAAQLADLDYLVASLRHFGGPGDLLAMPGSRSRSGRGMLIEVKGTTAVPWHTSGFGRARRDAMIRAGLWHNVEPILAWWPPGLRGGPIWLPPIDWPDTI